MPKRERKGRRPDERALYRRVARTIARQLGSGTYPHGGALPSRRRLARTLKVGEKTVRLALAFLASEGRLLRTGQGTYKVGSQGAVASARANAVALVLAHNLRVQWENPECREVQEGIEKALGDLWDPLLIVHEPARILRRRVPPDLLDGALRGILLMGQFTEAALKAYARLNVPVALVDRPAAGRRISSVCVDNESAASQAVHRLHAMGHRRMAFVRRVHLSLSDVDDDSKERQQGFLRALKECGIRRGRHCIHTLFGAEHPRSANVQALFWRTPPYTAVLAVDAGVAQLVARAAKETGKLVPGGLSVACFQSKTAPAFWSGPRINFVELGERAVREGLAKKNAPRGIRVAATWENGKTAAPPCRHGFA